MIVGQTALPQLQAITYKIMYIYAHVYVTARYILHNKHIISVAIIMTMEKQCSQIKTRLFSNHGNCQHKYF